MATMIYYYSLTGQCEKLSRKIADQLNCETERIIERKKRLSKGFLRFLNGSAAMQRKSADIEPVTHEPSEYDEIVIVTPFWAASPTPAIRGFLDAYGKNFERKKVGLVVTNLGTDPNEAFAKYQKLIPAPLIKASFTKAKGEWESQKEDEGVKEFISEFSN